MHFQIKRINKEKWSELGILNVSWNFENALDMKMNIDTASLILNKHNGTGHFQYMIKELCLQLST